MATYSLLQISLDQTIDRESLEEASMAAPSVARADCAALLRGLHGVLVAGIPREDAVAFQAELARRGFPTELVADEDLPLLHDGFTVQRLDRQDGVLAFQDAMGRARPRPVSELVFVAAGLVGQVKFKSKSELKVDYDISMRGGAPATDTVTKHWEEMQNEFRLDFFFWSEPHRFRMGMAEETTMFYRGQPLRLKHEAGILAMLADLAPLLPPERLSSGLLDTSKPARYPSQRSYEEEIRWHFHRLKAAEEGK